MTHEKAAPRDQGADGKMSGIYSTPEAHIFVLKAMLERGESLLPPSTDDGSINLYTDALKNAIRCINLVVVFEGLLKEDRVSEVAETGRS